MLKTSLDVWVNPEYVEAYQANLINKFRMEDPFPHAVLNDFLLLDKLEEVLNHLNKITTVPSHQRGLAEKVNWQWGVFSHLNYIRFFLSSEMRTFLGSLMNCSLKIKNGHYPQFNLFTPPSPGIDVHTDRHEKVGLVSLLQLSEGYKPGHGGELLIYRRKQNFVIKDKVLEPKLNTLILFEVSEKSFHAVSEMTGLWTRRTISYDFLTKNKIHADTKM